MRRMVYFSTILSVLIASIGILGLIILVANSKLKEISIRKVNGATNFNIFIWMVKSFASQILIAVVLSIPVTLWIMKEWLNDFATRITIGPGVFIISTLATMATVILVISYHTFKAARTNPIKALKTD